MSVYNEGTHTNSDVTTWALPDGAIARLGQGYVMDVAFSPNDNTLAVGSHIGLWLYDVSTKAPFALWDTERGMVRAVAFSPSGHLLATGNRDGGIKVWDVQNKRCLAKKERKIDSRFNAASQLAFSPDGQLLASSGGGYDTVYVWHAETGEEVAKFTNASPIRYSPFIPLCFSPDGNLLACSTPDHTLSVWDVKAGERIAYLTGHTTWVSGVSFSPCSRLLSTGDYEGTLREWDIASGQQVRVSSECAKHSVKPFYLPDGTLLATGRYDTTLVVWDIGRNKKLGTIECKQRLNAIRFSNEGLRLAIAGVRTIQVWIVEAPATTETIVHEHTPSCMSIKFSQDGETLAAGYGTGGGIRLWEVERRETRARFGAGDSDVIRSIDFSHCGSKLASGSSDTTVKVWDVGRVGTDGPPSVATSYIDEPITELKGHQKGVYVVAFSPKGDVLVSADAAGILTVWDMPHGDKPHTLTGHTDWIWSAAFSPDGRLLASASDDKTARVWDVEHGKQVVQLPLTLPLDTAKYKGDAFGIRRALKWMEEGSENSAEIKAIAFSPCGTVIAGGLWREIRLWDATTYQIRMTIFQPVGCQKPFALTFSPCGRYLVSGAWWQGTEKTSIRLWEVSSGENIATFWGHPTDVQSLAFSPDGCLLASGSFDGTILLWDMKPYLSQETA